MIHVFRVAASVAGFALAWWLAGWLGLVIFFLGRVGQMIDFELETAEEDAARRKRREDGWRYR
jgi:hypothetical protein